MANLPGTSWQARKAALRPERRKYPVVVAGALCGLCHHPRSSHSMVIMNGMCHGQDCRCDGFEPMCGCGHPLTAHAFDTPPDKWACACCACKGFGAVLVEVGSGHLF